MEPEAVEPALVIREGETDAVPGEGFDIGSIGGGLEPCVNEGSLRFGKEGGGEGVVMYEEVGE